MNLPFILGHNSHQKGSTSAFSALSAEVDMTFLFLPPGFVKSRGNHEDPSVYCGALLDLLYILRKQSKGRKMGSSRSNK